MNPEHLDAAAATIREAANGPVACAIVLGSGLGDIFGDRLTRATHIPYAELAGMPRPTVAGHAGTAIVGTLGGRTVLVFSGRLHLYEGWSARDVVYPVRIAAAAGARTILLTNAAGGLNPEFAAGDVMVMRDHLNFTGANPLVGPELLPGTRERFVDMIDAYDPVLATAAARVAETKGFPLRAGVYVAVLGPSYETPAEARWLARAGADAVGMSTVVECIAARGLGMRVFGVSSITNMLDGAPTTHQEVLAASRRSAERIATLLEGVVAAPECVP